MNHHHSLFDSLTGAWLTLWGLFMFVGVFLPRFRWREGRSSRLPKRQLSAVEQLFWSLGFIGWGVMAIVQAYR